MLFSLRCFGSIGVNVVGRLALIFHFRAKDRSPGVSAIAHVRGNLIRLRREHRPPNLLNLIDFIVLVWWLSSRLLLSSRPFLLWRGDIESCVWEMENGRDVFHWFGRSRRGRCQCSPYVHQSLKRPAFSRLNTIQSPHHAQPRSSSKRRQRPRTHACHFTRFLSCSWIHKSRYGKGLYAISLRKNMILCE